MIRQGLFIYDESYTVFLSTVGQNDDEVSEDLVNFLKYAGADITNSQEDYSDDLAVLTKKAARVKTIEEFEQELDVMKL